MPTFVQCALLALAACFAGAPAFADDAKEAQQLFDSAFAPRIAQAQATRDKADDLKLAQELLDAARGMTASPAGVTLLCDACFRLCGTDAKAAGTAVDAMELLAAHVPDKRAEALDRLSQTRRRQYVAAAADQRALLGESLISDYRKLANAQLDLSQYREAAATLRQAAAIGRTIKSAWTEDLERKAESVAGFQKITDRRDQVRKQLEAKHDDQSALKDWVLLHVVETDEPQKLLPYFGSITDDALKEKIRLAIRKLSDLDAAEALAAGEWYRSQLSSATTTLGKRVVLSRANLYFQRYKEAAEKDALAAGKGAALASATGKELDRLGGPVNTYLTRGTVAANANPKERPDAKGVTPGRRDPNRPMLFELDDDFKRPSQPPQEREELRKP